MAKAFDAREMRDVEAREKGRRTLLAILQLRAGQAYCSKASVTLGMQNVGARTEIDNALADISCAVILLKESEAPDGGHGVP